MDSGFPLEVSHNAALLSAAALAVLLASAGEAAHAGLFVHGATFEVEGTDSPNDFTDTVPLGGGSYSIDNGAVTLTITGVPAGGTDEWLVFSYTVTSGGSLSGGGDWSLYQVGLDAAVPVNFIDAYAEFLINGAAQPWSYSFFGGYEPMFSPVPGLVGTGVGAIAPFVDPLPAGPIGALGAYIVPFASTVNSAGIVASSVNGWTEALEFQARVPEPSTWTMMLAGFAGLGFVGYRRARAINRSCRGTLKLDTTT